MECAVDELLPVIKSDDAVVAVVGVMLAALMVAVLIAFLIGRRQMAREQEDDKNELVRPYSLESLSVAQGRKHSQFHNTHNALKLVQETDEWPKIKYLQ